MTQNKMLKEIHDAIYDPKNGISVRLARHEVYWRILIGVVVLIIIPLVVSCIKS